MDLENLLRVEGVWHRLIENTEPVHTAEEAANTGLELKRIAKSLVILDQDETPILAIIPGDRRLSFRKVKDATSSKKVKLAPYEDVEKYSGYPPGSTPMACHKSKMRTVLDIKLKEYDSIIGGGGTKTRLVEMRVSDVIRLNNAIVGDISE